MVQRCFLIAPDKILDAVPVPASTPEFLNPPRVAHRLRLGSSLSLLTPSPPHVSFCPRPRPRRSLLIRTAAVSSQVRLSAWDSIQPGFASWPRHTRLPSSSTTDGLGGKPCEPRDWATEHDYITSRPVAEQASGCCWPGHGLQQVPGRPISVAGRAGDRSAHHVHAQRRPADGSHPHCTQACPSQAQPPRQWLRHSRLRVARGRRAARARCHERRGRCLYILPGERIRVLGSRQSPAPQTEAERWGRRAELQQAEASRRTPSSPCLASSPTC